jgi:AcrR family transcriptional regulator
MSKTQAKKRRKSPGRPEGVSGLRDSILKVGRDIFAQRGYAGTSMKMISGKAGITTALITYYFGTKQRLHEEIFMQTAGRIGAMRIARLEVAKASGGGVKEIVSAFVEPLIEVISTKEGRAFLLFQWRVENEAQELSFSLRHKAYDASTHAYAEALGALLPEVGRAGCYARLACIIGATSYAVSGRHRLDTLLQDTTPDAGSDLILHELRKNAYKLFF